MASFFLGRWLGLGSALIGQGFAGHQTAYVDCTIVSVVAAGNTRAATVAAGHTLASTGAAGHTLAALSSAADTIATTGAAPDTMVTVQSGCGD